MKNLIKSVVAGSMVVASLATVAVNADANNCLKFSRDVNDGDVYTFQNICDGKLKNQATLRILEGYYIEAADTNDYCNHFYVKSGEEVVEELYFNPAANEANYFTVVINRMYDDKYDASRSSITVDTDNLGKNVGDLLTCVKAI